MSGPSRPNYSRASSSSTTGGWRAKLAKVKDYVVSSEVSKSAYNAVSNRVVAYRTGVDPTTGEKRQTWEEWARERRQRRREEQRGAERIALFPGWAVRRDSNTRLPTKRDDVRHFAIDVFVSGFASSLRTPEQATRSQKAFMSIARSFSALPKLPPPPESILGGSSSGTPLTQSPNPSTDDLAQELARMGVVLPPRPEDMTEETETRTLYAQTQHPVERIRDNRIVGYGATTPQSGLSTPTTEASSSNGRPQPLLAPGRSPTTQGPFAFKNERSNTAGSVASLFSAGSTRSTDVTSIYPNMDVGILRQLHANLDARLQPFWSSKLENRTIQVSLYAQPPDVVASRGRTKSQPLASTQVQTSAQGYFAHMFNITFEQLCVHDQALHIAFGSHAEEHPLYVRAELLPVINAPNSSGSGVQITRDAGVVSESSKQSNGSVQAQSELQLSSARVRLISDIDDTVKISEVLMGVRAIFHNVFVRHLDELVAPGMPEFYAKLAARGVGFHYSNGPFELLPVLLEFFGISNLPKGSVKLKSYGGRSIFQGLWGESAADRKRGNVVEVLDSFPESKFILVGDTGEQDLELYSALAQERPYQIVALFLRDVTPATPPPTAPPTPLLGPVSDHTIRKQDSASSLRSLRSLTGGRMKPKEELPKLQISQASEDSTGFRSTRAVVRSITDPAQSSPSTSYKVYYPRTRGSSGPYFDEPTPVAKRPELPPVPSKFTPTKQNLRIDPAGALVSAAATAGTGHSADAATDNTRAGILAKKEALRLRLEVARAKVPAHIVLRVFREPSECEDEAMQLMDALE